MAHRSLVAKIPVPAEAEACHHQQQRPKQSKQMHTHMPLSSPPPDHATASNLIPLKITRLIHALQMQHRHKKLQSQALTKTLGTSLEAFAPSAPTSTGGLEAGLSLSVAALPLSDPKIKPKEISKNQRYLTQPTQGKHPL